MEKVIRDGKVAVLYSPGFGAGWFTWNTGNPQCIFHPSIVALVENDEKEKITDELIQEILGCEYFYSGGAEDLKIEWVKVGTAFKIDEYDGYESISTVEDLILIA